MPPFESFDFSSFWKTSDYATREYVDVTPNAETLAEVEKRLGYKLPAAYVALAGNQNGGMPIKTAHRTDAPTSWAQDHVAITGIYSIGWEKANSLCGSFGSQFWIEEWGYPDIGIYFADCPSAGHDMLCLDYRSCGPAGDPSVVHVDQEFDFKITAVAPSFEAFIGSLEDGANFDID
ncbi:SMI1/KNR4 family protein [Roseateles asaccharophilus]|uniref:Knr4/Smi1-like domain-containing protein n=1 Tax=Roseateles asaccharophilus TaxID=582607 RepID=A0ABU2A670_9BURK|nr:SMI1/KNR4 family protein [Roseateles asaccharophilus]MDR7332693.1 hypothetical protein [Roseateles asaccharophilus]